MTLDQRATELFEEAARFASIGNVDEMAGALLAIDRRSTNRILAPFIEDVQQEGYLNAIPILIEHAERMVVEGNAAEMEHDLEQVRRYEEELGRELTKEFPFERQGYALGVTHALEAAERYARDGQTTSMESKTDQALGWAARAEIDIDETRLPDEETAYRTEYERLLKNLGEFAPDTHANGLSSTLSRVNELAARLNTSAPKPPEVALDIYANSISTRIGKILESEDRTYRESALTVLRTTFETSNKTFRERWGFSPNRDSKQ